MQILSIHFTPKKKKVLFKETWGNFILDNLLNVIEHRYIYSLTEAHN